MQIVILVRFYTEESPKIELTSQFIVNRYIMGTAGNREGEGIE
jgi:hypothetical protein